MIEHAVVVCAAGSDPLQPVAGLPLIKRCILSFARAGIRVVHLVGDVAALPRALTEDPDYARAQVTVELVDPPAGAGNAAALLSARDRLSEPFLIALDGLVCDPAIARTLATSDMTAADVWLATASQDGQPNVPRPSPGMRLSLDCGLLASGPALLDQLAALQSERDDGSLDHAIQRLATAGRLQTVAIGDAVCARVQSPDDRRRVEQALFGALRKAVDGPIARLLNRPISLAVTRLLLPTGITPNQMTLVSSAIGMIGVWLALDATWAAVAIGGVMLQIQSILDGCDGEIARLKFKQSAFGAMLDHIADDVSTISFGLAFGSIASLYAGNRIYWWAAIAGAAGLLLYNAVLMLQLRLIGSTSPFDFRWWFQRQNTYIKHSLGGSWSSRLAGMFHATGRRDLLCFAWMSFAIVGLPHAAALWFAVIGLVHGGLAIVHTLSGGITQRRPDRSGP